jgi:hypothetical protein
MLPELQSINLEVKFERESINALKVARVFIKRNSEVIILVRPRSLDSISFHDNHSGNLIINDLEQCCLKCGPQMNCIIFT